MKNTINEILLKNNIPYQMMGENFALVCPFKPDMDGMGGHLATFEINSETGHGNCAYCGKSADFAEISRLLKLDRGIAPSDERKRTFGQISPHMANSVTHETAILQKTKNVTLFPLSMSDILTRDFGEEEWVVESLIPRSGMMVLSGNPGDFKTWVAIHIAMCVSRGEAVFDKFKTTQGNILVIDEENPPHLLQKRLRLLGTQEVDKIYYLSQNSIKFDDENFRDAVLKIVKEKDIKLVIIDSLVRVHNQDENDAKGMTKVFSNFVEILKSGASILFTHHHRKQIGFSPNNPGQNMRGSSDILVAVDCHVSIEKKKDEKDRLILRQTKLRQAEMLQPFEITVLKGESGPSGFRYVGDHDEKRKKAEEVIEVIIGALGNGRKSREEIQENLINEFGKTSIDNGIKIATESGKIERVPTQELPVEDRRKAWYRLTSLRVGPVNQLPASQLLIGVGNQGAQL